MISLRSDSRQRPAISVSALYPASSSCQRRNAAAGYTSTNRPRPSLSKSGGATLETSRAYRIAMCEMRSVATESGHFPVNSRMFRSVSRKRSRDESSGVQGLPWPHEVMSSANSIGHPKGASTPTRLTAGSFRSRTSESSSKPWSSLAIRGDDSDHAIRHAAVFGG